MGETLNSLNSLFHWLLVILQVLRAVNHEFAKAHFEDPRLRTIVSALMEDTAQIMMRSVTSFFTIVACEWHDHIVQAFVLEKSPLPLAW